MDDRFLSVVIPVGPGREALLGNTVFALNAQTYAPFELVLVGAVDTPEAEMAVEPWLRHSPARLIPEKQTAVNTGGHNRNVGAKQAHSDFLVFVDSDIILQREALSYIAEDFRNFPRRAIAGMYHWLPPHIFVNGSLIRQWTPLEDWLTDAQAGNLRGPRWEADQRSVWRFGVHQDDLYCDYAKCLQLFGGILAVHRATFSEAGGFWEALPHGEDGAFAVELCRTGHVFSFDPRVVGFHQWHDVGTPRVFSDIEPMLNLRFHSDDSWIGGKDKSWGWPVLGEMR